MFARVLGPFLTIVAIMVMTAAAGRLGVLDCVAETVFRRASFSIGRLYFVVFLLSAATASLLNNDAAILLLTPLVLGLVRQRYPDQPQLLLPFAFAVFMAPGVELQRLRRADGADIDRGLDHRVCDSVGVVRLDAVSDQGATR